MRKLNEKKHLLLSRKEDAQLEDHIAQFIYDNKILIKNTYFSNKNDFNFRTYNDDNDNVYIELKNFIQTYLNNYNWLENNYKIRLYHDPSLCGIYGGCYFKDSDILDKVYNCIIEVYLNLDHFSIDDLASFFHHEFLHIYEAYNKVKNKKYIKYHFYEDFHKRTNNNFNTIIDSLYLVSPEERKARLQNFYHEIKGKTLKDSKTYNDYMFNYKVVDFIRKNNKHLDKDLFIDIYGDVIEEIIKIKRTSSNYFEKICKYLIRYTNDTIKRMKDIDNYINNSKPDDVLESLILYHRKKNNFKNIISFERGIRNRILEEYE